MSRLDPSSSFKFVASGGAVDFSTNQNQFPDGCSGIYPFTDGAIDFTDQRGIDHTAVPVFAGNVPPFRGKLNITATTSDLLIGLN